MGPSQGVASQMKGKGEHRRGMRPSQGLANQVEALPQCLRINLFECI